MARERKPTGELAGGYFDNHLAMTGAGEESSQLLACLQAWGPGEHCSGPCHLRGHLRIIKNYI